MACVSPQILPRPGPSEAAWRWLANPGKRWSQMLMFDEILTLPDVAKLLKVGQKTVYTMTQNGAIPGFKVGGQW